MNKNIPGFTFRALSNIFILMGFVLLLCACAGTSNNEMFYGPFVDSVAIDKLN
ncbi:hypothetical protein ANRL1_02853 [Anaerolineae bacterium]|nr:hypothetical protein ANRL1_02853 [Anaerolineae bacterium]